MSRQYYKPYGEVAYEYKYQGWSNLTPTSVGYTGQRLDGDSGLMYYGDRFYDPVLSHFVSADPTVADGGEPKDYHKYLYVRGNPLRYVDSLGYGPEDYYLFVQGCISSGECDRDSVNDWGEYTAHLRYLYEQGNWGQGDEIREHQSFDVWARTHVRYVEAHTYWGGAENIRKEISSITDKGEGVDIHLLGHSMGGGAIAWYLMDEVSPNGIDKRVKSAVMIDAPLNILNQDKLGASVRSMSKRGLEVIAVDTPYDWVSHPNVPDLLEYSEPIYHGGPKLPKDLNHGGINPFPSQEQVDWHDWTSLHAARETVDFMHRVWR